MYDDAVAEYNKLKEQTTWISVKDRLPENDVRVLVYTELKNTLVARRVLPEIWEDDYGYWIVEDVTHWKPLPDPPESEDVE